MDRFQRQGVYETLADIFETVFLVPLECMEGGDTTSRMGDLPQEYVEVRIDLRRERNCPAFFFFPAELVEEIAGSFLGLEAEAMNTEELAQVAMMVARMAIGGLLARVDPDALVRAGEPRSRSIDNFIPGRLSPATRPWVYKTGQGYLWVDVGWLEEAASC